MYSKQQRPSSVNNPNYITDKYGKLEVVLIPRDEENSIQEEILELKAQILNVIDTAAATKVRQLHTLNMSPNTVYSTSSTGFNGGGRLYPLDQCLRVGFLLRGNKGVLRISAVTGNTEPYQLRPAGFLQTYIPPHYSEYYLTYIPEDPLDITPRVLEIDYIFNTI